MYNELVNVYLDSKQSCMTTQLERLKTFIKEEVFVRQGDELFVPESSAWIMDFRRVCLDPHFLDIYTEVFYERFKEQYPFQIGGMEVAAIPLVSAIVMKMREKGMPVNGFFIRKSRKKTGLLKMVEGKLTEDPVVLVDDLINNGYTLDRQLKVIAEANRKVVAFFVLLRFRDGSAYAKYGDLGIRIESLFSLDDFRESLGTMLIEKTLITKENFDVSWYFKAGGARLEYVIPKSGLVLDDKRVYMGTDRGIAVALDLKDGKVIWEHRIGLGTKEGKEIFSTPVLYEGKLYFGAYDGNVYCLDAETGKKVWVSFEADWIHGSPVISSERKVLYVPTVFGLRGKEGGMVALNLQTGKALWRKDLAPATRSTPTVVEKEKKIFVGGEDGTLFALNIETGQTSWSFKSGGAIKDAPTYDEKSGMILFSSFDGAVYALRASDGFLLWKYEIGLANYSSPYLWQDKVYVTSLDKNLYCLNLSTGRELWKFPTRARIFSSPRIYENKLYFGANDARLYQLDPLTGKQTGFFQSVERITNPLLFEPVSKKFLLQTYANEIYCLNKSQ